jgi:hypothetical protein
MSDGNEIDNIGSSRHTSRMSCSRGALKRREQKARKEEGTREIDPAEQ